jgi:hypothetical protein
MMTRASKQTHNGYKNAGKKEKYFFEEFSPS